MRRIAILLTCFNRRALTLQCLAALSAQRGVGDIERSIFLVDDGSADGTAEAVRARFPSVRVLYGDGTLFWNGGMRRAFAAALQEDFDDYVLLNDDTILCPDALRRLIICAQEGMDAGKPAIVAGSIGSPASQRVIYGGFAKYSARLAMSFKLVTTVHAAALECDTMNGNWVLIPSAIAKTVGNLEPRFRHQFGDLDYGLRARRAGFGMVLAPGLFGTCRENPVQGTWRDRAATFTKRWKHLLSPKGVPPREWLLFTWRHYGWRWPLYAASPFLKTTLMSGWFARAAASNPGVRATQRN
ncbi:MAG: glycosyltransferase family 2 protein [Terracidiphilus sp.]